MTNFAHALGWIILVIGMVMTLGVGHVAATEPAKRTGAFTFAAIFVTLGEVLSRL